jgi:hypothetical protein
MSYYSIIVLQIYSLYKWGGGFLSRVDVSTFRTPQAGIIEHVRLCQFNGRLLEALQSGRGSTPPHGGHKLSAIDDSNTRESDTEGICK